MKLRTAILTAALLAAPVLTACGKTGDLERPGPLWGPDERPPAERAKEDAARREASRKANQPAKPGSDQEVRDPASSTANRYSSSACMVRISVRVPMLSALICFIASNPPMPGIDRSMTTTSGFSIFAFSRPSSPVDASPTTTISSSASSNA
jgi:hypothetical protein